ncbi:fimbrial protein [Serratia aquatilis]|uniref:Fimbrial protein n=1 Tax=Serratia aquatilis TaxID=1737515 RepID=A0ABV6ED48_9GAMM
MNKKNSVMIKQKKWASWALALCGLMLTGLYAPRTLADIITVCTHPSDSYITIPPMSYSEVDLPAIGQPISQAGIINKVNLISDCYIKGALYDGGYLRNSLISGRTYTEDGVTYPIYSTNVPGIGVIVGVKELSQARYTPAYSESSGLGNTYFYTRSTSLNPLSLGGMARLIVTGKLSPGVYTIAQKNLIDVFANLDELYYPPSTVNPLDRAFILSPTTLTITARTCQMTSDAVQNVALPKVTKSQFSGVGSSPNVGQNFIVSTQCEEGVNLYATMTDATNPANSGNILTPGEGTTASGVGVQILRNDIPVAFGPDSSAAGNMNQWYIGSADSGPGIHPFIIPLKARYVQTAASMTAGAVKARTTITFSYQ